VEKINAQKGIVKLKILGTLPNPAYDIHHVETNIESDEIVIIPWAIHDPNKVVIQMIVSFEKEVEIKGLKKGTYTLIVKGSEKECLKKLELE
jgi:hypothetical protein